jgi:uncharacterized membrane protein
MGSLNVMVIVTPSLAIVADTTVGAVVSEACAGRANSAPGMVLTIRAASSFLYIDFIFPPDKMYGHLQSTNGFTFGNPHAKSDV